MKQATKQITDANTSEAPEKIGEKDIDGTNRVSTERREMETHHGEERSWTDKEKREREFASSPWKAASGAPKLKSSDFHRPIGGYTTTTEFLCEFETFYIFPSTYTK